MQLDISENSEKCHFLKENKQFYRSEDLSKFDMFVSSVLICLGVDLEKCFPLGQIG